MSTRMPGRRRAPAGVAASPSGNTMLDLVANSCREQFGVRMLVNSGALPHRTYI